MELTGNSDLQTVVRAFLGDPCRQNVVKNYASKMTFLRAFSRFFPFVYPGVRRPP